MNRKPLGAVLMGVGGLLVLLGIVTQLGSGDDDAFVAAAVTSTVTTQSTAASSATPTTVAATTTAAAPTTTAPAATTTTAAPTTTAPAPTTTTLPPTTTQATTTTLAPSAQVAVFIESFSAAIAAGDVDALLATLHQAMILGYGEDVCRGFIADEILLLTNYQLTGAVTGPQTKTLETGVGSVTVENIYEAAVSFVFRGEAFDATADFVLGDEPRWLATCR
ncbi:MAG: hypothetical protein ACE5GC_00300 [Acidimicrobiia bacterium]